MKKLFFTLLLAAATLPGWADEYYLVGGATECGWNGGEWNRSTVRATQTGDNTWVAAVRLTAGDDRFKILNGPDEWDTNGIWGSEADQELTSSWKDYVTTNNDQLFRVAEEGMYLVSFNTSTKKIKADKLTEPSKDGEYFLISNLNDYWYFAAYIADGSRKTAKARLTNDLTFDGNFVCLASDKFKFKGEFDGNGHTIDYAVVKAAYGKIGLFTYLADGANIHDLIMGENCRFEGTVKTGGIAGYARDGGTVTLTNVINKAAAVSTGGSSGNEGNSAGFIACATDKTIINATNCANMGLVSGQAGQCAAFAGWTQDNEKTGDELVKTTFTNCWNSGTIYNTEGTAQLYRNSGKVTATNCYDASASASRGQGILLTEADAASGNLCFLLNGKNIIGTNWYQTMGTDNHPFPFSSHGNLAAPTATDGWYEISKPWQLYFMANGVNESNSTYGYAKIKLTADIDYTQYTDQASMLGKPSNTYKGTFDGQYHAVTVAFNNTTANETGLFRRVNGATIQNLKVDGNITTNKQFAGGIVSGIWQNGTIKNCISAVKLTDTNTSDGDGTHGGILGWVNDVDKAITVSNCLFIGEVDAPHRTGCTGVVGWTADNANVKVNNCLVSGTLNLKNANSNGVISRSTATYSDNYYTCDVSGDGFSSISKTNGTEASAKKGTGELCYLLNGSTQGGTNWTQTIGTDTYPIPFNTHKAVYLVNSNYKNLFLTDGKAQIANATDLQDFSSIVNAGNTSLNAELTGDIDMSSVTNYTPIGTDANKYEGTFDGKGFHINNLTINSSVKEQGLFSVCAGGAIIKNLVLGGSIKSTADNWANAAFVAVCNGSGDLTFENCGNEASVEGTSGNNAAFLGKNWSTTGLRIVLKNCYNTGTIKGGSYNAAFVGESNGKEVSTENCYNMGSVERNDGGNNTWINGTGTKSITNCYTTLSSGELSGLTTSYSEDKITSGELCYNLGAAFTQDLSQANSYPTFGSETVGGGQWFGDDYIYYNVDESGNITVNELNLDDTKTAYNVPAKVTAKSVTLTRTLHALTADGTQPRWNTFCSPVAIAKSNFSAAKELTGVTANGDNYSMTFTDVEGDVLEAGKPYMVQVSESKSSLTASNVAVAAAGTSTSSETFNGLTFTGNFTNGKAPQGSFIISNNVFYNVDSDVTLKAFRGYITTASGNNVKALTFDFDDDATGISLMEDVRSQMEDGAIYNLAGQRINKMQRGINIVNGKKILK